MFESQQIHKLAEYSKVYVATVKEFAFFSLRESVGGSSSFINDGTKLFIKAIV